MNQIEKSIVTSIAIHEAGHALALSALGADIQYCAVFDAVAGGGRCAHSPIGNHPWESELENCIRGGIACMSGKIAEQMFCPHASATRRAFPEVAAEMLDRVLQHRHGIFGTLEPPSGPDADDEDFAVMALSSGIAPKQFVQLCLERLVPMFDRGRGEIVGLAKRLRADAFAQLKAAGDTQSNGRRMAAVFCGQR